MDGTLATLLYATVAALAAGLGALPSAFRREFPERWLGWANALAAGLMLGIAYILTIEGLRNETPIPGAAGAVLGILWVYASHAFAGTSELRLNLTEETPPDYGYKILLVNSLHSASEGLAIGVAMVIEIRLGIVLALAFGVHNVAEAVTLTAVLRPRGVGAARAAILAILTNASQVLLAVTGYAVIQAAPIALPWALGFAVGAMIYLSAVELLPEAYDEAHHTGIAVVAAVAISVVALVRVLIP